VPATILSTATAVPPNAVGTDEVKEYFPKAFALDRERDERRLAAIYAVIDNACIRKRHFLFPLDYTISPRPLDKVSCEYKTNSIALGQIVAEAALAKAGLEPREIDLIITVSCTGVMIPSLDAYLINLMGFRSDVKRLPITELGCAAGAAALARAAEYIRAFPDAKVLIIAVELPSLTFQRDDPSPANFISCCLFGDGAAAAVMVGGKERGLRVVDSLSHTIPGSLDAMGFDLRGSGFHIVLSKDVPQLIRSEIGAITDRLLERNGLGRGDLRFHLLHPGGRKLLNALEEELALPGEATRGAWKVLDEYGNLSSATVLFVLKEFLDGPPPGSGSNGMLAAFGPGFGAELVLLEWN
jgi:alkylresorcinol/alkylpyrone synthase